MKLAAALRAALCGWVVFLPVLALRSAPGPDQTGFGLPVEMSCRMSVSAVRECAESCGAPVEIPTELPDDASIEICCTMRLPVPQLGSYLAASMNWNPLFGSERLAPDEQATPIARPQRPPVPPPKRESFA